MNRTTHYLLVGIFLAVAQAKGFAADSKPVDEITAPGEVQLNAYASAQVTPRIAAQIMRRHVHLGDEIKAGVPLVTLSSVEMAEAQGALMLADAEWNRVQKLGKEVVSERRYVEAQTARQLAYAKVIAYGMTREQVEQLLRSADPTRADGSFTLVAPRAGRVILDDFIEGKLAEPGKVLFEITDESMLWVQVRLSPTQATGVRIGMPVQVRAGDTWLTGRVIQTMHRFDEQTRTYTVRCEVRNRGDALHSGQFVDVRLPIKVSQTEAAP